MKWEFIKIQLNTDTTIPNCILESEIDELDFCHRLREMNRILFRVRDIRIENLSRFSQTLPSDYFDS